MFLDLFIFAVKAIIVGLVVVGVSIWLFAYSMTYFEGYMNKVMGIDDTEEETE